MSSYVDFLYDFPARCADILERDFLRAKASNREVTLLLMVATSAFVVPYERLRPPTSGGPAHPAGDGIRHVSAASALNSLLDENFLDSTLCHQGPTTWTFGTQDDISQEIDSWTTVKNPKPLTSEKSVKAVLNVIRNALAHGNVHTDGARRIDRLIFASYRCAGKPEAGFNVVSVNPTDFRSFLRLWFQFLQSTKTPQLEVVETMTELLEAA